MRFHQDDIALGADKGALLMAWLRSECRRPSIWLKRPYFIGAPANDSDTSHLAEC